jgi:hypothetical protein
VEISDRKVSGILPCEGVMRRRGLLSSLGPTVVLGLVFITANNGFAQSAIQGSRCTGVVHGIVSDREGHPVKGIRVVAWPLGVSLGTLLPNVKTDLAGEYRFENVCPGRYTVLPADENMGYPNSSPKLFEFLSGRRVAEVTLTSKNALATLPVQLPPKPGRMHIRITDAATSAEILEFTIELKVPDQHLSPKVKILFQPEIKDREIEVPPNRDCILHVTAEGFREWSESIGGGKAVRVPSGTEATLNAQLQPLK